MAGLKDGVFGCGLGPQGFCTGEGGGEGTPRPCDFSLGVHGVCLTKFFILYHDL